MDSPAAISREAKNQSILLRVVTPLAVLSGQGKPYGTNETKFRLFLKRWKVHFGGKTMLDGFLPLA
jgi:hypothetical protein